MKVPTREREKNDKIIKEIGANYKTKHEVLRANED
jgi:hypothetical protein